MVIPAMPTDLVVDEIVKDSETNECELEKIEFPDPKIVNENQIMVFEYFEISYFNLDFENFGNFVTFDTKNQLSSNMDVHVMESFSTATVNSIQVAKLDSPPTSKRVK